MKYEPRWKNSAELMHSVLNKMSGDHRRLCALLDVSRSFVEMLLRGEKSVPPYQAHVLANVHRFHDFERFVHAYVQDVSAIYRADAERHARAQDPRKNQK